jgi:hypothetical protein
VAGDRRPDRLDLALDLLQFDAMLGNHRLHAVVERRLDLVDGVVQGDDGRALLFRRRDRSPR